MTEQECKEYEKEIEALKLNFYNLTGIELYWDNIHKCFKSIDNEISISLKGLKKIKNETTNTTIKD